MVFVCTDKHYLEWFSTVKTKLEILISLKIKLLFINKTEKGWIREGQEEYLNRLKRYISVEVKEIESSAGAKRGKADTVSDESDKILTQLKPGDYLILLDENGKECSSENFAKWLNHKFISIQGDLVFVVGGAYGFSEALKQRASEKISLSQMTFTHQMVRIIFVEQLYRAMTILRNEPYHHS